MGEPTTHKALELTTAEAVTWAVDHPGWVIFPGRMVPDGDGGFIKRPLVKWKEDPTATARTPEEVKVLWSRPKVGGKAVVCVACQPSGLFILDEDSDPEDSPDKPWKTVLEMVRTGRTTLVLRSGIKGRPHYVFRQPISGDPVAEGKWEFGDVKSSGMVMLSSHEPIVDVPVAEAHPNILALLKRRPAGLYSGVRGIASDEDLNNWLDSTQGLLSEDAQRSFLDKAVEKLIKNVDKGEHRRQAALAAVYHCAMEAAAGCYSARAAYERIQDEYERFREGDSKPSKRWTPARQRDYENMWGSLVPEFRAGDHDTDIEEIQARIAEAVVEEWSADLDEAVASDLEEWIESLPAGPDPELPAEESLGFNVAAPVSTPTSNNGKAPRAGETSHPTPKTPLTRGSPAPPTHHGDYDPSRHGWRPIESLPLTLHEDAYWGVHGEFIEKARPHTEASDPGLLAVALACCGTWFSQTAHFNIGNAPHGPNLFIICAGDTAVTRKTTSLQVVKPVYFPDSLTAPGASIHPPRDFSGIASGERLIHMWEPIMVEQFDPGTGTTEMVPAMPEARVLWSEGEVSVLFKRSAREGATLTETVCALWDQGELQHYARTASDVRVGPEAYRVGMIGLTTVSQLRKHLNDEAVGSGLGNRFLWFHLADTGAGRDQPWGGSVPEKLRDDYRTALDLGRATSANHMVTFDNDARDLWLSLYSDIKRGHSGTNLLVDALLSRNAAQILRLALNYHLANGGTVRAPIGTPIGAPAPVVGVKALKAAIAVWDYNRASVMSIFGGMSGDPDIDEIVNYLKQNQGYGWAKVMDIRVMGRKNTAIDRGVKLGVLRKGVLATRGRPSPIVGVREWIEKGKLSYESDRQKEIVKWL